MGPPPPEKPRQFVRACLPRRLRACCPKNPRSCVGVVALHAARCPPPHPHPPPPRAPPPWGECSALQTEVRTDLKPLNVVQPEVGGGGVGWVGGRCRGVCLPRGSATSWRFACVLLVQPWLLAASPLLAARFLSEGPGLGGRWWRRRWRGCVQPPARCMACRSALARPCYTCTLRTRSAHAKHSGLCGCCGCPPARPPPSRLPYLDASRLMMMHVPHMYRACTVHVYRAGPHLHGGG